jgi:hypothetical protein
MEEILEKGKKEGKPIKDLIEEIKTKIMYISCGITPSQLFSTSHPLISNDNNSNLRKTEYKSLKKIPNISEKEYQLIFLNNENNGFGKKILVFSKNFFQVSYNFSNEGKNSFKFQLWKERQIKIEPISNMVSEIHPDTYLICRYIDNMIQIISEKQNIIIKCTKMITSVEFLSRKEFKSGKGNNYISSIIMGDEKGVIYILKILLEYNSSKKCIQINGDKIKIQKKNQLHNSFIQGIKYRRKLNIIFTYSAEGQVTIINSTTFNIINVIELGEKFYIKNLKISNYDIIYILCYNRVNQKEYIKGYTLNGVKVGKFVSNKDINNYFIKKKLTIVYESNLVEIYNSCDFNYKPLYSIFPRNSKKSEDDRIILSCLFNYTKLLIIYKDKNCLFQDLSFLQK